MLQDTVAISCLFHPSVGVADKQRGNAVHLLRKPDSCSAKWLQEEQFILDAWVILMLQSGRLNTY